MHQDVLDPKVTRTFAGKVVRKGLLHQIKGGENMPSYALEYLLGRYCASDDEDEIRIGIEAVKETLRSDYFRHDEANKAQALVEQRGRHRFIDRVEVRFLAGESKYWASMDHFGYTKIHVPDEFYRRHERLLEGGIWAIVDVEFRVSEDGSKGSPFHIADLRPIQLARFDLDEYLLAIEGRRRVKEQLKKRGSFEFYKTSFSYIDQEAGIERTVGLPEQSGPGVISQDPLLPGTIYTAAANEEAKVGLFRLEVTMTAGTGKLRTPAGLERGLKESLNRAFRCLQSTKDRLELAQVPAQKDLYAAAVDLSGSHIECPCGVAFFVAMISAIQKRRIQAGTVNLGDLTIQGNIRGLASIVEPLQLVMEGGALRALVPLSNKSQFAGLPEEVVEKLDIIFYGDVDRVLLKSAEL